MGDEKENRLIEQLRRQIIQRLDMSSELVDEQLYQAIDAVLADENQRRVMPIRLRLQLRTQLYNSFRRLDVLSEALDDPDVTEIMVNGPDHIFVEKFGEIIPFGKSFASREKLEDVIQQIVAKVNRRVNEACPFVDARLEDQSRVNAVLPPIALDGPILTIRRFQKQPPGMQQLLEWEAVTPEIVSFLECLVKARYNIMISGGTGSGKTTFLGALAEFIPDDERIITIEDSAELRLCSVHNLVRLEARNASQEGSYAVTIRDLIRNSLRMRPDRLIVGEVRGGEIMDIVTAMNCGHEGSATTGHANSGEDMVARMEMMASMSDIDMPLAAIRAQIASAIDIIIHLGRLRDKSRKLLSIHEVCGLDERGRILLSPLYRFKETEVIRGRIKGELKCENRLQKTDKIRNAGLLLPTGGSDKG